MVIDWNEIRQREFPAFNNGIHLKAAGGSPLCRSAMEEACARLKEMTFEGDLHFEKNLDRVDETRTIIATYLGVSPKEIGFTVNSSTAAQIMSGMLKRAGITRVFYPRFEFPTTVHTLKSSGIETHPIGDLHRNCTPQNWLEEIEKELEKVEDKSTCALVASHVSYLNGATLDLDATSAFCLEKQIRLVVNATQSFGSMKIDLHNSVDILFATGLKWACAGYGAGFIYLKQALVEEFGLDSGTGWLSVTDPYKMNAENISPVQSAQSLDAGGGMPHFPSLLALYGAMKLFARLGDNDIRLGVDRIQERVIKLATSLRGALVQSGFKLLGDSTVQASSGIVSVASQQAEQHFEQLARQDIHVSLRNHPISGKREVLRFGVHFYNNERDIELALEVLSGRR